MINLPGVWYAQRWLNPLTDNHQHKRRHWRYHAYGPKSRFWQNADEDDKR